MLYLVAVQCALHKLRNFFVDLGLAGAALEHLKAKQHEQKQQNQQQQQQQ
jgi:hypothetical protein